MNLLSVAVTVFILNLPFGYWRANVPKLKRQWFVAIHLPVFLAIGLRLLAGVGFDLMTFPALVAAFSAGQFLGGKVHGWWRRRPRASSSSCLVLDLYRELSAPSHLP